MAKNKKIVKYRKPFELNIGVIIFFIVFLYVMFYIFTYFTTKHTSAYEVYSGSIAVNHSYTGLVLRSEQIYNTDTAGYINYFLKDGSKAGAGDFLYSIDSVGTIAKQLNEAATDIATLNEESITNIQKKVTGFHHSFTSGSFYEVYNFKEDLNAELSEALNLSALSALSDQVNEASDMAAFTRATSPTDGIVVYYTDGYEEISTDTFTSTMFDQSIYKKNNLKTKNSVAAGDEVYKLITSEDWNIIIPITEETKTVLGDSKTVRVLFTKDKTKQRVNYSIVERDNELYLVLNLHSGMIRYTNDRFLEVELLFEEEKGLKIPNSAIVDKVFYTIPVDYFEKGDNSNATGVIVRSSDGDQFVTPTVYYSTDQLQYVDSEILKKGDILVKPNSTETYTVGETNTLKGVYNINKGYAIFKKIEVMYQNEDYSIVESGTSFGVSMYDHIALDGSTIKKDDFISSK